MERLRFILLISYPISIMILKAITNFIAFLSFSMVCDTYIDFGQLNTDENYNNGHNINEYNGDIEFRNFSLQIDSKIILKNINLKIKAGERILICGRTGSGKSTLITCMLRLHSPQSQKGSILVDGQNINDFDLKYFRSSIAFMHQVLISIAFFIDVIAVQSI